MNHTLPKALPGYEHIKRFWDSQNQRVMAKVLPGEFYVSKNHEVISTVLGSCIAACVYDPISRVGGLNHFMLPTHVKPADIDPDNTDCRYGNWAMEFLINEVLKHGAARARLQVKLFGGGKVINSSIDVGLGNIRFAHAYLQEEGLALASEDVGGPWPRKIVFSPTLGRVQVKKLQTMHNDTIAKREINYMHQLSKTEQQSDIELF